jgi:hypothetical protein
MDESFYLFVNYHYGDLWYFRLIQMIIIVDNRLNYFWIQGIHLIEIQSPLDYLVCSCQMNYISNALKNFFFYFIVYFLYHFDLY